MNAFISSVHGEGWGKSLHMGNGGARSETKKYNKAIKHVIYQVLHACVTRHLPSVPTSSACPYHGNKGWKVRCIRVGKK